MSRERTLKANKSVGEAIASVRASVHESLKMFATRIQADRMQVFKWERDEMVPKPASLLKLIDLALQQELFDEAEALLLSISDQSSLPLYGVVIAALMEIEKTPAPDSRGLSRLAKRAEEILAERHEL